ncbi:MAG: MATE family efflux transporter [Firmicutes bacterium]|nr:MATE family efflux transporter [Bacillota bacterium]
MLNCDIAFTEVSVLQTFREKFIGDRAFYKKVLALMIPILIQNVITNFVGLLDNIMVGRVGTEPMSGVAIVNEFIFIFNLAIFGIQSGAGIFTAQFHGKKDEKGVSDTFKIRIAATLIIFVIGLFVFIFGGEALISTFLHKSSENIDLALTMRYGKEYLGVMLWGLLPFGLLSAYAGTLRETGNSRIPMISGLVAVFTNMILNYILIFGKLGIPAMGVRGAALATVISRLVDMGILVVWTHRNPDKNPFVRDLFTGGGLRPGLIGSVMKTSLPLFINETMWSTGITIMNQSMSTRGVEVVSAMNISNVITQLFMCSFFALGNTLAIIIGQSLGAGELERAVDEDRKMLAMSLAMSCATGCILILIAPYIPQIYNTTDGVKSLATTFITISSILMPFNSMMHGTYFTLRSGGKVFITMLFDCGFVWGVTVPVSLMLSRLTSMPIVPMYIIIFSLDIIKMVIGLRLVHKRIWVNNLVDRLSD